MFTRNGLYTYIHTYTHTYIHTCTETFLIRYLSSACSKTDFSTKIFFLRWILKIFVRLQYTYLIKSNRYNKELTEPKEIACEFNTYFSETGHKMAQDIIKNNQIENLTDNTETIIKKLNIVVSSLRKWNHK